MRKIYDPLIREKAALAEAAERLESPMAFAARRAVATEKEQRRLGAPVCAFSPRLGCRVWGNSLVAWEHRVRNDNWAFATSVVGCIQCVTAWTSESGC